MTKIITIVLPEGEDYEAFAKRLGVEVWDSDTLFELKQMIRQARSHCIDNNPVRAYMLHERICNEIDRIIMRKGRDVEPGE